VRKSVGESAARAGERLAAARVSADKALGVVQAYVRTFSALECRLIIVCFILSLVAGISLYLAVPSGIKADGRLNPSAFTMESTNMNMTVDLLHDECMNEFHTHLDKLLQLYALDMTQYAHQPTYLMQYANAVQKQLSALGIAPTPFI
jgi:hypothetical protein